MTSQEKELLHVFIHQDEATDMHRFLGIMLTPQEYKDIVKRLQILKMLHEEKPQREISKKLNISIAKVTRGSKEYQKNKKFITELFSQSW